jgi:hypothetical protein
MPPEILTPTAPAQTLRAVAPPKPHVSVSQLNTYSRCSMQWFFRYVEGFIEPPKLATGAGKAGHAVLETNSKRKIRTGEDMPMEEILDHFSATFDFHMTDVDDADAKAKGETKDNLALDIQYWRQKFAPTILPILVEHEFTVQLDTPEPTRPILGFIDLAQLANRVTKQLGVWDYKFTPSSRTPKSQLEVDTSPQLTMYDLVIEQQTGLPPAEIGYYQLMPPGKDVIKYPPDVRVIRRNPALLTPDARRNRRARLAHQFMTMERAIQHGIFIPTEDPRVCSWCGYRAICQDSLVASDYDAIRIREQS